MGTFGTNDGFEFETTVSDGKLECIRRRDGCPPRTMKHAEGGLGHAVPSSSSRL